MKKRFILGKILIIIIIVIISYPYNKGLNAGSDTLTVIDTQYHSKNPTAVKQDYGFMLFWEEQISVTDVDIRSMKLNDKGEPVSEVKNISYNSDVSTIVSVNYIEKKYFILSKRIYSKISRRDYAYTYEMIIYDDNEKTVKNSKILNSEELLETETPKIIYDGMYIIISFVKKTDDPMNTKVFIKAVDTKLNEVSENEVVFKDPFKQDNLTFYNKFYVDTKFYNDDEIVEPDTNYKFDVNIFNNDEYYDVFFRCKSRDSFKTRLYRVAVDKAEGGISPAMLVSLKGYNVFAYDIYRDDTINKDIDKEKFKELMLKKKNGGQITYDDLYDRDNHAYIILWRDEHNYFYQCIDRNITDIRNVRLEHIFKDKSDIIKTHNSYLYSYIISNDEMDYLLLNRFDFKDTDIGENIRLYHSVKDPADPFILKTDADDIYEWFMLNESYYDDPDLDESLVYYNYDPEDPNKSDTALFWSNKDINDTYQIKFRYIYY